jgi:hypothetical protein
MKAPLRSCSAQNFFAFSACVAIVISVRRSKLPVPNGQTSTRLLQEADHMVGQFGQLRHHTLR